MMRSAATAVSATMVLLLAGCSVGASTPSPSMSESDFIASMRTVEALIEFPDDQLIVMGGSICTSLRQGSTIDEIVVAFAETGYEADDALTMISASTHTYCPEQGR